MGTITAIRNKGRASDRFVVEVDEKAFAIVDFELRERHALHVGDVISAEIEEKLRRDSARLETFDRAVRMLSSRGRAKTDLKRRLMEKGAIAADAEAAVERLSRTGLLDDAAFAKHYVRTKSAGGHGPRRLAADLARQGVERSIASQAIAEVLGDATVDAKGALERVAERKLKSLARFDAPTKKRRLFAFLARRGHEPGEISRVLKGLVR